MKKLIIGEKHREICEKCKDMVEATLKKTNFEMRGVMIRDVLVFKCDRCGEVTTLPHQSMPQIMKEIRKAEKNSKKVKICLEQKPIK